MGRKSGSEHGAWEAWYAIKSQNADAAAFARISAIPREFLLIQSHHITSHHGRAHNKRKSSYQHTVHPHRSVVGGGGMDRGTLPIASDDIGVISKTCAIARN